MSRLDPYAYYYCKSKFGDKETYLEKLEEEDKKNIAEALLLNEKLRRKTPEHWDSTEVIKKWRKKR